MNTLRCLSLFLLSTAACAISRELCPSDCILRKQPDRKAETLAHASCDGWFSALLCAASCRPSDFRNYIIVKGFTIWLRYCSIDVDRHAFNVLLTQAHTLSKHLFLHQAALDDCEKRHRDDLCSSVKCYAADVFDKRHDVEEYDKDVAEIVRLYFNAIMYQKLFQWYNGTLPQGCSALLR